MKHTVTAGQWNELFTAAEMTSRKFLQSTWPFRVYRGDSTTGVDDDDGILVMAGVIYPLGMGIGVHVMPVGFQPGTTAIVISVDDEA